MPYFDLLLGQIFFMLIKQSYLKYVEGILSTSNNFATQNLLLYYDDPGQWPSVYRKNKTCREKERVLNVRNNQILPLTTMADDQLGESICKEETYASKIWLYCSHSIKFTSHRERWWFLAIDNCENNASGLFLRYKIWMTNGNPDDFWFYQFSADEFYVLQTDLAFFGINLIALILSFYVAHLLKQRHMLHTTYKLYLNGLGLECLSLMFLVVDCIVYANDGIGLPLFKLLGNMAEVANLLTFQFTLIPLAKGYTVTRGKLSKRSMYRLSIFMTIYTLIYTAVFLYQARFFDPGMVTYLYESAAGYCAIAARLLGWLWFCYAIYFTLIHYPEKRPFYLRLLIFYSLWFWTSPILVVFANNLIGKWMREKIINGIEKFLICIGYVFFLILTRPSAANANFPYHVRVNQIGSLDAAVIDENPNVREHLPHHLYELDARNVIFTPPRDKIELDKSQSDVTDRSSPATNKPSITVDDC